LLLAVSAGLLWVRGPRFDHSPDPLKPRESEAAAALAQIKARLGRAEDPLWVLVRGKNEQEVARGLGQVEPVLSQAKSNHLIAGFTLARAIWPRPEHQQANRPNARRLAAEKETLRAAALAHGFTPRSLQLTENLLECWEHTATSTDVYWPTNKASRWAMSKLLARPGHEFLALGVIHQGTNAFATRRLVATWPDALRREGVVLSGWPLLGSTVFELVTQELPRVVVPVFALVVVTLWLAFRNFVEVLLSLATLAFSGLCLGGAMTALGWEWNLINLMALPLLLGMGVDYSIHVQLALRRCQGDRMALRHSVGRALLLAGATTMAGFGSLGFSSNLGMASLGKVCALGIFLALVTAVYLLPVWWRATRG
jgi:predicted exporter